ncbi:Pentatricopeptide repeat-containing protein [Vitis vinifera]|uniref:Pentatricopeptide repeat-containing protein n=1 Tax=Vitis vinifera TaxID=29760 RepID=A0A438BYN2_VITVI|nr:Pentatricopeptide repeat-containing protein [Vitis vinifera]
MITETLSSLLHHCSKTKALRCGLSLHAAVLKTGTQSDVFMSNHVLNMYAKCGHTTFARQVFDEMFEKNLVSWSAMISGYDQAGEPQMAIDLYSQMFLVPNEYVFASVISACASLSALTQGQKIHSRSLKFGYESISFVSNSLISMYMKCNQCSDALSVFTNTPEPNCVSYNALITGFVENQQLERGFEFFKLMRQQGLIPDRFAFMGVLGICTTTENLKRGTELHCQTVKLNLDSTPFIGNVIITMYSELNLIQEAEKAFRLIEEKDVISWNTLIAACSHCDDHAKGLRVFKHMTEETNVRPDDFTFTSALAACAGLASMSHGKQIHAHLMRTRLYQDLGVDNALVNMYAKCGCIGYAYDIFSKMVHHNLVSWNTIIAGFGNHGLGERAVELFEQMNAIGIRPDSVTFIGLLTACNHAGLVDKGQLYFNSMEETYGIAPDIEHFSCLIDMLGRAGRLNEAEEYMRKFPFWNDPVVLPVTTSPYVLLSNLYASDGMWDSVAEARKRLKRSGLKKEPGHSLIEVNGSVEKFTIGDFTHLRIKEIKGILKTLSWAFYDQLQRQGVHTLMWTGGVKKGRVSEILIQGHNSIENGLEALKSLLAGPLRFLGKQNLKRSCQEERREFIKSIQATDVSGLLTRKIFLEDFRAHLLLLRKFGRLLLQMSGGHPSLNVGSSTSTDTTFIVLVLKKATIDGVKKFKLTSMEGLLKGRQILDIVLLANEMVIGKLQMMKFFLESILQGTIYRAHLFPHIGGIPIYPLADERGKVSSSNGAACLSKVRG